MTDAPAERAPVIATWSVAPPLLAPAAVLTGLFLLIGVIGLIGLVGLAPSAGAATPATLPPLTTPTTLLPPVPTTSVGIGVNLPGILNLDIPLLQQLLHPTTTTVTVPPTVPPRTVPAVVPTAPPVVATTPPTAPRAAVHRRVGTTSTTDAPAQPVTPARLQQAAADNARAFGFPFGLAVLVVGFLLLQQRLDARDPRLAAAPVDDDLRPFE